MLIPENAIGSDKLWKAICQTSGEPRLSLDSNFDSFHRTEENISKHFSRCRTSKIDQGLVLGCILRSCNVCIFILKELVESVLAGTLSTVTNQSGRPTPKETSYFLLLEQNSKSRGDALVLCWVNLKYIYGQHKLTLLNLLTT